jgi:Peptidase S46
MKKLVLLLTITTFFFKASAREGMWLPQLLQQINESEMQQMGMKITASDIYSVNNGSLKDAIVQFGGGCTGEVISSRGLLLTNHHCGFSNIQALSSIENNHLVNGFWANSDSAEIPCPGLTVTFIKEIIDVTAVFSRVDENLNEETRSSTVKFITDSIVDEYAKKKIKAIVRPFYGGNEYFLFLTEVFRDIRLVGTPPASIGKFGGETDNWLWPRHTGDFALFRIYSDSTNKPADFSKTNVPYKAGKFLEINIEGVKEGDFTFIYGFPGRTNQYLTASSLDLIYSQTNPNKIKIREERLNHWRSDMYSNDTIYLKYSSKFKTIANFSKKWRGENIGLKNFKVVEKKKEYESMIISESNGKAKPIIDSIAIFNSRLKPLNHNHDYYVEALQGIEFAQLAVKFQKLITLSQSDTASEESLNKELIRLKNDLRGFHKNYSKPTDKKVCFALLKLANSQLAKDYKPSFFSAFQNDNDILEYTERIFEKSLLSDSTALISYLDNFKKGKIKRLQKDEGYKFGKEISSRSLNLTVQIAELTTELNRLQRKYIALLRETDKNRKFYPDANSTLRIGYGNVNGMRAADAKYYTFSTTTDGILEKIDRTDPDFDFPLELETLIRNKDFGSYAKNGSVPVGFISSNHTTGGNSGSPVLNAKGQLIGINFDRLWEGNMSDYYFDENTCRNIAMDMHFFLFVVEKYGKATRLIDEMRIVR